MDYCNGRWEFQSTPPMQGATGQISLVSPYASCFNPRPLCRERRIGAGVSKSENRVSIHAPYAGSDRQRRRPQKVSLSFQSTPPMQGATTRSAGSPAKRYSFNPRPLCRERLFSVSNTLCVLEFQSTPPMQGATTTRALMRNSFVPFQSTPPMQGATMFSEISSRNTIGFNPRPLCRERHNKDSAHASAAAFQSTPPMQGATQCELCIYSNGIVSIHAPYAGSDRNHNRWTCRIRSFNPRPLCRERRIFSFLSA